MFRRCMTTTADRGGLHFAMTRNIIPVNLMAGQACHLLSSQNNNIAYVFKNMPFDRYHRLDILLRQIDLKVTKEIITGNEGIGIGQA